MNNWFNNDTDIEISLLQGFRLQLTIDMQAKQIPHHRYNPFIARCLKEDCEYTNMYIQAIDNRRDYIDIEFQKVDAHTGD